MDVPDREADAAPAAAPAPSRAADGPPPVFIAHGLAKTYLAGDVPVPALKGADLRIGRGELVVLLGPSGSGKSTLLNILGGLETASAGTLDYAGPGIGHRSGAQAQAVPGTGLGRLRLTSASDAELTRYRREHVGFVFQFYNLIPSLTARENVALVTDIATDPMPVDEALERVALGHRGDHFPAQLSGGEQQRVAIARAIVKRPQVLLCDEPTGALDIATGRLVLQTLARINAELGTTTLVITHNAAIAGMADRVLLMGDGRLQRETVNPRRLSADELHW